VVILFAPAFNDHARLSNRSEEFPVQALVAEFIVEALDVGLFPRRTRADVKRPDLALIHPIPDGPCNEFRAVIAANMLWLTVLLDGLF